MVSWMEAPAYTQMQPPTTIELPSTLLRYSSAIFIRIGDYCDNLSIDISSMGTDKNLESSGQLFVQNVHTNEWEE